MVASDGRIGGDPLNLLIAMSGVGRTPVSARRTVGVVGRGGTLSRRGGDRDGRPVFMIGCAAMT
jgi:hypothetical protein